jgi:hypothetical protein
MDVAYGLQDRQVIYDNIFESLYVGVCPKMLNEKQKDICLEQLKRYQDIDSRSKPGGMTFDEWHEKRMKVGSEIDEKIKQYLSGKLALSDFRWEIDSTNKRNRLWGFDAWKGMFYFNMILKSIAKFESDIDKLIRDSISEPNDDREAIEKMKKFYDEVEDVAAAFDDRRKGPNPKSTPYFLSYFWQIQNQNKWPIHYPSTESAFEMLGLWNKTGDTILDAKNFLAVIREIHALYQERLNKEVPLRLVGHVIYDFYLKQQEDISKGERIGKRTGPAALAIEGAKQLQDKRLPDKYVPPVVSILPQMAKIDSDIEDICREEGIDLPTEFEKRVTIALRLLGFEVERRGQGTGREPDIIARTREHNYALIIDVKARKDLYRMGTDDRQFSEYINREIPNLRKEGAKKYYFGIVSSGFSSKVDLAIQELKVKTEIHGVFMLRAEDLLLALDLRLRNPDEFDLGERGFMRLLAKDGVITKEDILGTFSS